MASQALLFRGSDEVLQSGSVYDSRIQFLIHAFLTIQFFWIQVFMVSRASIFYPHSRFKVRGLQVNRSRDFNTIFKRAITALKEEAMVFKNHQMLSQGRKGW
ncbi:hypothetical protein L1987_35904 [Smallanthus sonchifolius]|uniref:Uncharacterized protein n=1 Tax=Smallanthus sonchifolius TaxID=185202 RepID=A0ACB9HCX1_9ASTR|nr:hypothetical protein L1987_35904 [Smallanthus sonchifolius]